MGFCRCVLYLTGLGLLAHVVGERLPKHLFCPERFPFSSFRWEKNGRIYERLGIRRWKDLVPDMSRWDSRMQPKRLRSMRCRAEFQRLLRETCIAESVHWGLVLLSPMLLFLWPGWGGRVLMLTDIFLGNLPFILIQRYNRPRLTALLRQQTRWERNHGHEHPDTQL